MNTFTNYASKYEECNNYGYYKDFVTENYAAMELIKRCEGKAREKYNKFKEILKHKNKAAILDELREEGLLSVICPELVEEITQFSKLPIDCNHPFSSICLRTNWPNDDIIATAQNFNIYGLLKIKERSKADLFDDTHFFMINKDNGASAYAHVDISNLIGIGIDIRKTWTYNIYMQHGSTSERNENGKITDQFFYRGYDESEGSFASFTPSIEYNAVLLRIITNKFVHGDIDIFAESIVNAIFNKFIRLQVTLYTYCVYIYGNRDIISNNLETFVKMAFLFKLVYNSVNSVDTDDLGDSIKKLMRDFNYCVQNRGVFDSVIITADLWRNKLIKGYQDLPSFSDDCINEILELYQKKRHAIVIANRQNRPMFADKMITGIQIIGNESLQSDFLTEFNLKNAYSQYKRNPSMVSMESATDNEFLATRAKLVMKITPSNRGIYIGLENDLMKIKSDAMNCKTTDGMKILMNKINTLGSIIAVEMDTKDEALKEALGMLDGQRIMLSDLMASRSIIKENAGFLYGMVKMDNKIL